MKELGRKRNYIDTHNRSKSNDKKNMYEEREREREKVNLTDQ